MTTEQIIVTLVSIFAIIAVYWFFLGKKSVAVKASGDIEIIVDGGYTPESIEIPLGSPTTIHFLRKDPSSCLEDVVLGDFSIRRPLPLNERVDITITPQRSGTFQFTCGMGMYHGTIIVR